MPSWRLRATETGKNPHHAVHEALDPGDVTIRSGHNVAASRYTDRLTPLARSGGAPPAAVIPR